ncbi:MAG TPA: hypothetical protein VK745_31590 [Polyangiaceae bacterium]|jgi:hypothetical protein|nr:hypothetical protein [Polyangiaceae bacterium]
MTNRGLLVGVALLGVALAGCGSSGAAFTTQFASGYTPAPQTVSVLGVYQDGRMSLGTWADLAPHLSRALGSTACPAGYDALVSSNQDLANAIDEFTRDEGPNAELLKQLAPAAHGDLLLVVTLSGKVPKPHQDNPADHPSPGTPGMAAASNSRKHSRGGRGAAQAGPAEDTNHLDVSAALFSVAQNRPVALISMQYSGESVEDALTRFSAELSRDMPSLKCVGWHWDVNLDPARIHPSIAE